jgi:hypothetical protein
MSINLWCAGVEYRNGSRRMRWRSCGLVLMDRERWRASAGSWLTDQSNQVTSLGGWHLGHAFARGRGGVDRVAGMIEDWRDTSDRGGRAWGGVLTTGLVVWASKPPNAMDGGFCWVWASKLGGGGTWHDRVGCVKAKQLRVKDVAVGSKT